jgi:hypothetical protein
MVQRTEKYAVLLLQFKRQNCYILYFIYFTTDKKGKLEVVTARSQKDKHIYTYLCFM